MTTTIRVAVLLLLLDCAMAGKALASVVPWCAPEAALLTFKDQKGLDVARVELRSVEPVCSVRGAEKAAGVSLERFIRIEYRGRSIDVPRACVSGVSFRLDDLSLSVDRSGVGIEIIGKSTDRGENMTVSIYFLNNDNDVTCGRPTVGR
jgi:hypothetical protein